MFSSNWISEKQFRLISILLFLFLFIYLILRAIYVDYLHDEAATFLHYIETGYFFGPKSYTDANNHILNSIICHGIFKFFGENRFLFRLPNLICFPVYFWAIWQLFATHKSTFVRILLLVGTTCIPFIIEYFANSRGYGISIAFFLASLVFLRRGANTLTLKNHFFIIICLWIASYANLTYLVSSVLASAFILIQQFRQKESIPKRQQVLHFVLHLLFALSLVPAGIYARVLKNGGALYYGRLDGLWDVTGTTLSSYTLFTDHIILKWIFLILGIGLIFILIKHWAKEKFSSFFGDESTLFAWFLFGHLFVILVLAVFMEVNYPEDRVGMYLIPLFLLMLASEIKKTSRFQFLFLGLLFFPITFIPRINLVTSVFSPDDRMTQEFYSKVDKELKSDRTSVSIYHLMQLTWSLQNRNGSHIQIPMISNVPNNSSDLFLSRENLKIEADKLTAFDTLFLDESNGFIAYKRKAPWKKTLLMDTLFSAKKSTNEFIGVQRFFIADSLKNKALQIHIKGKILVENPNDEVSLTYAIFNKDGELEQMDNWVTRWSNGLKQEQEILVNYPIDHWSEKHHEVRIYFFNRWKTGVAVENLKFELLQLE